MNFNSLAPCGANRGAPAHYVGRLQFQLTRPVRGEPFFETYGALQKINFNSLAPCGANLFRIYII